MPYFFIFLLKLIKNNNKKDINNIKIMIINIDSKNEGMYSINKNLNKTKNNKKNNILKKNFFNVPSVNPLLLSGVRRKNTASSGWGRASLLHGIFGIEIKECKIIYKIYCYIIIKLK